MKFFRRFLGVFYAIAFFLAVFVVMDTASFWLTPESERAKSVPEWSLWYPLVHKQGP